MDIKFLIILSVVYLIVMTLKAIALHKTKISTAQDKILKMEAAQAYVNRFGGTFEDAFNNIRYSPLPK